MLGSNAASKILALRSFTRGEKNQHFNGRRIKKTVFIEQINVIKIRPARLLRRADPNHQSPPSHIFQSELYGSDVLIAMLCHLPNAKLPIRRLSQASCISMQLQLEYSLTTTLSTTSD